MAIKEMPQLTKKTYALTLSDGAHLVKVMLAYQQSAVVEEEELVVHSIIKVMNGPQSAGPPVAANPSEGDRGLRLWPPLGRSAVGPHLTWGFGCRPSAIGPGPRHDTGPSSFSVALIL